MLKCPNNGLNHPLSMTNPRISPQLLIVQVLEFLVFYSDPRVIIKQIPSKSDKKICLIVQKNSAKSNTLLQALNWRLSHESSSKH